MRAPAIGERWEARQLLAVLAALAVAAAAVLMYGGVALADHIPDTGQVPSHCVKFDFGTDGEGTTKSPADYPDVDITLDDWYNTDGNPHSIDFTIAGLEDDQYVDASTKSGNNDPEDFGPYGNGEFTITSELQNAISHVTFCVFEKETPPTTTTPGPTTTTTGPTTTTTGPTTTTTEPTTTTTEPTTTSSEGPDDTVLPTVVTSTPDEVDDEELPFTGVNSELMIALAILFLALGAALLALTRRVETD
jgi:type II secretory pathway pseudopilin PulG